ncbi:spore germination protein [Pontibacillus halophilus]|uniref:spore germination protein n=1 Tax=Pontibacillus halophilus TaxID=516704 RepID=UPI0009DC0B85
MVVRRKKSTKTTTQTSSSFPCTIEEFKETIKTALHHNPDLHLQDFTIANRRVLITYFTYQINKDQLNSMILRTLLNSQKPWDHNRIMNEIPIGTGENQSDSNKIAEILCKGHCCLYVEGDEEAVTFLIPELKSRQVGAAENESLVFGPQIAFNESLVTNLNIVRWGIDSPDLKMEKLTVGKMISTEVRVIYLDNLANKENVNTIRQRIEDLEVDDAMDANVLGQLIEDKSSSIFPQLLTTELPDRFLYAIKKGKVGIMVDKSPNVLIGPTSLFSFFESTEDIYMRWNMGTFIRILRLFAMMISITLTPAYVAALTYHYEVVPSSLLVSLGKSRANVPFPPVLEALLLELLIELLREAGARLPTKVGQTMGIVGGVVIGQAAVKAGFTSNILIIVIALSALASFTAPSYLMGTAIRVIRFPMILLSGLWGLLGIMYGLSFLIIHLLKLTSLGRPFLVPLYPLTLVDLRSSIFRLPWPWASRRPYSNEPQEIKRFSRAKALEKKDIDE